MLIVGDIDVTDWTKRSIGYLSSSVVRIYQIGPPVWLQNWSEVIFKVSVACALIAIALK